MKSLPVYNALTFLLEHLPPQSHPVIATREDLHLPLASFRVQSQLTELRATDLRVSLAEAARFPNQVMGLNLSAEDIVVLATRPLVPALVVPPRSWTILPRRAECFASTRRMGDGRPAPARWSTRPRRKAC